MNDISKLSDTTKPKSDQTNFDDLLGGPITVTITAVARGNTEQPIRVSISGGYQPYYPCKSMRRVLIAAWGDDGRKWIGRSMTLYGDPEVMFGGVKVGGIRISHLSHISGPQEYMLTTTRSKRKAFHVEPLAADAPASTSQFWPKEKFDETLAIVADDLKTGKTTVDAVVARFQKKGPITTAQRAQIEALVSAADDGEF